MNDSISLDVISVDSTTPCERRDAAANRLLLLETAKRLFREQGAANVNMADIAKEAGVGKGTLYRRFANKGDLCLQILDKHLQGFQNEVLLQMREMTAAGQPYMAQLDQFLDQQVQFIYENLPLMVEIELNPPPPENMVDQDINAPHFWIEMTVRALLTRAAEAQELSPELDLMYTASALMATLNARTLRYQLGRGFTLAQISSGLRAMVAHFRIL